MKRVLLTVLVVGLLATQASAGMYMLDVPMARQFTQMNTPNFFTNQLYLVIDKPGTAGSTVRWAVDPAFNTYGENMQLDVGFVGQLLNTAVMTIGMNGSLPTGATTDPYTSFGSAFANDDDDLWAVRPYVKAGGVTYTNPTFTTIAPHTKTFLSTGFGNGTVTQFGFQVDYVGSNGSDNFHISVVPVPAAVILGLLGLGAAGIRLRKFA